MNPDDHLEARLRAVRPPEPPWELVLRLRGAEASAPATGGWRWSWPMAYTGVLASWSLIAVLRLLTLPLLPAAPAPALTQASPSPFPTDADPLGRSFLLTRNGTLDPSWQ